MQKCKNAEVEKLKKTAERHFVLLYCCTVVLLLFCTFVLPAFGNDGDIVWQYGDARTGKQEAKASAVDPSGNVIITGYQNLSGGTDNDYYTVKVTSDGSGTAWAKSFNKAGGDDQAVAVTLDSNNDVIVTGYVFNGTSYDLHTIKYNGATGAEIWQQTYNGSANGNDYATAITVDSQNNVYVGGYTQNSSGNDDYLILKYSAAGTLQKQATYNGAANGQDRARSIASVTVDGSDYIAVTGMSEGSGTGFDYLTSKYNSNLTKLWEWRYNSSGSNDDRGTYVKMDSSGNVVVTGYKFNGTDKDIYTIKYNGLTGSPTPLWAMTYDGGSNDEPNVLWIGIHDNIYVTGYTSGLVTNKKFCTVKYDGVTGGEAWHAVYGPVGNDTYISTGIVVDATGDVFVTGYHAGANDDFVTIKYKKENGSQLWVSSYNGTADNNDRPVGIGLSATGDVFVAGWSESGPSDYDYYAIKYDPGLLNLPTNLTAAALTNTMVGLTWTDNSDNEDGFKIERKICGAGLYTQIATAGADVTTYNDDNGGSGLIPDTNYCYQVRAYNNALGDSHPSNEASAKTTIILFGPPSWFYTYNGPGSSDDITTAIAAGPDNNPVVTGYSLNADNPQSFDYYTIKINRTNGSKIWEARYAGDQDGPDEAGTIAVDSNNAVIVSGYSYLYSSLAGADTNDVYTIKYPSTGLPATWVDSYDGTSHGDDRGISVATAVDGSNNIAVAGYGQNSSLNDDIYIMKYTTNGTRSWASVYNGGGNDYPSAVAFDPSGNIFVAGAKHNGANYDMFIAKYNGSTGALLWSDTYNGAGNGNDEATALAVDTAGNVYVTGYAVNASGNEDFYTIKYNGTSNTKVWQKSFNGTANGNDSAEAIKIDPVDGSIVVSGTTFTGTGNNDFYVIQYDTDGNALWQKTLERPVNDDYAISMEMDISGNVCIAGNTSNGSTTDMLSVKYNYKGNIIGETIFNGAANGDDFTTGVTVNKLGEAFISGYTRNGSGNDDYVVYKCAWDPLQVPTLFNAVPGYTSAALSWTDNATGEDGYEIQRKNGVCTTTDINNLCNPDDVGCTWTWRKTFVANTTSYTDTGLNYSTTYCYRIKAYKNNGEDTRWIGTQAITMSPLPPSGLTAAATNTTQINLTWTDNTTVESGFKIYRCEGSGCTPTIQIGTAGGNAISYPDTTACMTTIYRYCVTAYESDWESACSNIATATTPSPVPPTITAISRVSEVQISLTWSDNNSDETGYKVDRCSVSNCSTVQQTFTLPANTITYNDTGLTPSTTYYYRVYPYKTATCLWSPVPYSTIANAMTTIVPPGGLIATAINTTQISLTWTNNTASQTGFVVQRCSGSTSCTGFTDLPPTPTVTSSAALGSSVTYSDTSVCKDTIYRYQVRATKTSVWDSDYSIPPATATTPSPVPPTITAISRVSEVQISLTWSDNNSDETGYKVDRCIISDCSTVQQTFTLPANTITYNDTGLTHLTTYYYRVYPYKTATCVWSPVPYSNIANATTSIAAPSGLTAAAISTTQINLTWTNNTASQTGFVVQRCSGSTSCTGFTDLPPTPTVTSSAALGSSVTYSDTSVCKDTIYRYQVRATKTSVWDSGYSIPPATATTPSPGTITLIGTAISETQIDLSWTNVYDEENYKIYSCPGDICTPITLVTTKNANVTTYSDLGLSAATAYNYQVKAGKTATCRWDIESNVLPISTLAPPAPADLTAYVINTTQINLSWTDKTGSETEFRIQRCTGGSCDFSSVTEFTVGQNSVGYQDTSVCNGTTYRYRVRAEKTTNPVWNPGTDWSNIAPASTILPSVSLTVTQISELQINLSWTDNTTDETGFKIERKAESCASSGQAFSQIVGFPAKDNFDSGIDPQLWSQAGVLASTSSSIPPINISDSSGTAGVTASGGVVELKTTSVGTGAADTYNDSYISMVSPSILTGDFDLQVDYSLPDGQVSTTPYNVYVRLEIVFPTTGASGWNNTSVERSVGGSNNQYSGGVSVNGVWNGAGAATSDTSGKLRIARVGSTITTYAWTGGAWLSLYSKFLAPTTTPIYVNIIQYAQRNSAVNLRTQIDNFKVNTGVYSYADTGVTLSTTYCYRMTSFKAITGCSWTSLSNTSEATTIPMAPANLNATAVSLSQINLTWTDKTATETGFRIQMCESASCDFSLVTEFTVDPNITAYNSTLLKSNTTYSYRVRAEKSTPTSWDTDWSNTATATIQAMGLSATVLSETEVQLSWNNVSGETGYKVQKWGIVSQVCDWGCIYTYGWLDIVSLGADVTTYTDTGLTANTAYQYRVMPYNGSGDMTPTNQVSVTTTIINLTVTTTPGVAYLSWSNASNEIGYKIERCIGANCTDLSQIDTTGADVTTYSNTGLTNNLDYCYRVVAYDNNMDLTRSSVKCVNIGGTPTNLSATANTTQANLTWGDNSFDETGFRIQRCEGAACDFSSVTEFTVGTGIKTYLDTSLCYGTTYRYRVRAENPAWLAQWSDWSNIADVTTTTPVAPNLYATMVSETQINLTWTDENTDESGFEIFRCIDSGSGCTPAYLTSVDANVITYNNTGLASLTTYRYIVKTYKTAAGCTGGRWELPSGSVSAVTTPIAPSSLSAVVLNATQINLTWTDKTVSETMFKIYRCEGTGCTISEPPITSVGENITNYSDLSVCNTRNYTYCVMAAGAWGDTACSGSASATTPTPVAPNGLSAIAVSVSQINLTWNDNTSGTTEETGFIILRCIDTGSGCTPLYLTALGADIKSYSDTSLLGSTNYCYQVRAYKQASCDWQLLSNIPCAKTYPDAPIDLTATALDSKSIKLDWTDKSSDENGFEIEFQVWNKTWVFIAAMGPNVTTYTHNFSLQPEKLYGYRIRSFRGPNMSGYSNEATARTLMWNENDYKCP